MDIDGFSEKTAAALVEATGLSKISELYELTEQSFSSLDGFKDKKISNILNAIEKSKDCGLAEFLYALGIPSVGSKTASELADVFRTLDGVRHADVDELLKISDIGNVVANDIVDYFTDPTISAEIDKLLALGVSPRETKPKDHHEFISGKAFVVTGTLSRMGRKEIEDLISSLGGRAVSKVTKKTDYVIVGTNAGSKLDEANRLNVPILSEDEFFDMIK